MAFIKPWQVIATTTPQNIYGNSPKVKREELPRPACPKFKTSGDFCNYVLQLESYITIDASGKREAGKPIALPVAWYEFYTVVNFCAALQLAPDMATQIPIANRNHLDAIESAANGGKFDASALRYAIDNASGIYDKNRQNRAAAVRILVRQADGTDKGACLPHTNAELFEILWTRGFMPTDCAVALRLLDQDGNLQRDADALEDIAKLRELQATGNDADHICAAFDGVTNEDRKRAMDKERAKHLGNDSDAGDPGATPRDDTTPSRSESSAPSASRGATILSESIESPCDTEQRAKRPIKPDSVRKRAKTANKGEIAFD
jgi:hypothetical protein